MYEHLSIEMTDDVSVDPATGLSIERAPFAVLFDTEDRETCMCDLAEEGPDKARLVGL